MTEQWTPPAPEATAAELVAALAAHDPAARTVGHADLAAAVTELHDRGPGAGPTWTVDDPIVALVRAVAMLARRHPGATSRSAARVIGDCGVPSGPS